MNFLYVFELLNEEKKVMNFSAFIIIIIIIIIQNMKTENTLTLYYLKLALADPI